VQLLVVCDHEEYQAISYQVVFGVKTVDNDDVVTFFGISNFIRIGGDFPD
jgi:hypothetical protein